MLYFIGLGLGDVKDITVKGLEAVQRCSVVYLEAYTSILCHGPSKEQLEEFYGKEVRLADRDFVEQNSDEMLDSAKTEDVAFLVVGDPFGATTHSDLLLRAKQSGVIVNVIHNASIMNAVACCGLQLYNFGETVSIVMWTDEWKPDSYYAKIAENRSRGLHTLCLLDIKVKEQTTENLMKGRPIFEPPRYMTCSDAAKQLLEIVDNRKKKKLPKPAFSGSTECVGLARVGWDNQRIVSCTLSEMCNVNMGDPLHSLVICGNLHPMEVETLQIWK